MNISMRNQMLMQDMITHINNQKRRPLSAWDVSTLGGTSFTLINYAFHFVQGILWSFNGSSKRWIDSVTVLMGLVSVG